MENYRTPTGYQKDGIGLDIILMPGRYMIYSYDAPITHQGRPSDPRENYKKIGEFSDKQLAIDRCKNILNLV